jgi:cytochrome c5
MIRMQKLLFAFVLPLACISFLAQAAAAHPNSKGKQNATTPPSSAQVARGQKVFQQNCSRCHDAPEAFPPQISATILRHMRVRASLSDADEKALLHFMNP